MSQTTEEIARKTATEIARAVAEICDRFSPEDQPQMMLVTQPELEEISQDLIVDAIRSEREKTDEALSNYNTVLDELVASIRELKAEREKCEAMREALSEISFICSARALSIDHSSDREDERFKDIEYFSNRHIAISSLPLTPKEVKRCAYGDPFCPCQDGDTCHYEGSNAMRPKKALDGKWQPIETAPRERTPILAFGLVAGEVGGPQGESCCATVYWNCGASDYEGFLWKVDNTDAYAAWMKPTHWQPLPPDPKKAQS